MTRSIVQVRRIGPADGFRKAHGFGLALFLFALLLIPAESYAQSIAIVPNDPSLAVGATVQFAAQLTDLSSSTVTWSVANQGAGNATVGTITSSGLYTAPAALPAQNPVQIIASSGTTRAITYVYMLALGPTITSVSPNPLPVGTI